MHIANNNTVWHSYTKVKAGKCYGIITKRVDGVVVLTVKETFSTRKDAKKAVNIVCKQLAEEQTNVNS
jgi:hypothetical protein